MGVSYCMEKVPLCLFDCYGFLPPCGGSPAIQCSWVCATFLNSNCESLSNQSTHAHTQHLSTFGSEHTLNNGITDMCRVCHVAVVTA